MKSKENFRKFIKNNFGTQGFSEEEYSAWLEKSKNSNPGANPNNPWIAQERKKEREI
jgi:predicted acetyltransferase